MKREAVDRFSIHPQPEDGGRNIRDVAYLEAAISFGYGLLIIGFTATPERLIGAAVRWWIDVTSGVTRWLLILVPDPSDLVGNDHAPEIATYRHLLAFSLLIACGMFAVFHTRWPYWAARANVSIARLFRFSLSQPKAALIGYCYMVQGLVATTLILLYGDRYAGSMTRLLFTEPWTFLRAPLFTTLAFVFACQVAALRLCIARSGKKS